MLAIWLALLCAVLNSVSKIVFRFVLRGEGNPWSVIILNNLIASILFIGIKGIPSIETIDSRIAYRLLIGTLLWILSSIGDINSHRHLDAATNAIFGTLRYALLAIACMFIFGEHVTILGFCGIGMIIVSVGFSADLSSLTFRVGALYRLMALIFCNLALLNDKDLLTTVSPDLIILYAFLLPGIVTSLMRPRDFIAIPDEIRKSRGWILLAPMFQVFIYGLHVYSMKMTDLLVTATVAQTQVVFTFILGILILGERKQMVRRGIAALLCAAGAVLVSVR